MYINTNQYIHNYNIITGSFTIKKEISTTITLSAQPIYVIIYSATIGNNLWTGNINSREEYVPIISTTIGTVSSYHSLSLTSNGFMYYLAAHKFNTAYYIAVCLA